MQEPAITPELIANHGLKPEEYDLILEIIGREPTFTELGIFSAMWNEHCSYKSSKKWLRTLPTTGPQVICGPGENAGVVDIGDGQAVIFKMESHNHPSYIEPYQGAATGVGGILRDVFTMGARPVAAMNSLSFGETSHPKTRQLVNGVVEGVGGYGNCFGVPTVGGEVRFDPAYNGNCLVNAFAAGLADADKIFYSAASGVGMPVVYLGAKTGRDGVGGATMASAEFDDTIEEKRPTVQVGDPFTEKRLMEATLELMATGAVISIQDMGAAGLTSSSVEMGSKGEVGIELDLDHVPQRETGMTAYEMMLSESQERMLMVLKPGREEEAMAIFRKWDLDFAVIGKVTDTRHLTLKHKGAVVADIPLGPLVDDAPNYDRPHEETPKADELDFDAFTAPESNADALRELLETPDLASKRWIWQQYDHMVMGDTIGRPGSDAGVVRIHGTSKALAVTTDCTPRYCKADPYEGGKQAVAETWRNITATGAMPLAITNCLNFGNPEKPAIMGQFVGCIEGMAEACVALDYPVVSGNVSLYNETNGQAVLPTPAIGGVGLLANADQRVSIAFPAEGQTLIVIGDTKGHLGQSLYARELCGREDGAPPHVNLTIERHNGDLVRELILNGAATACHDVSGGGLLVAVAEMAMAARMGATLDFYPGDMPSYAFLFGEDQGRYVITTPEPELVMEEAAVAGVSATVIGVTGGDVLKISEADSISVAALTEAHEGWLPAYMAIP
jgi:phosphoribosylformylglycinamidine synthase